jgi:hypothetical protein
MVHHSHSSCSDGYELDQDEGKRRHDDGVADRNRPNIAGGKGHRGENVPDSPRSKHEQDVVGRHDDRQYRKSPKYAHDALSRSYEFYRCIASS